MSPSTIRPTFTPLVLSAAVALACLGCEGEEAGSGDNTGGVLQGPLPTPHACGVRIKEVSVTQAVKIPLVVDGKPVSTINAPLIENRRALFRAYFAFDGAVVAGNARARLRLESSTNVSNVDAQVPVPGNSTEDNLTSTVNFDVPAELMRGDLKMAVELELGDTCKDSGRTSYPAGGLIQLPLIDTGTLKVQFVPIVYDADSSGRLPDTTPAQIESYRQLLLASYPVGKIDITVRDQVRTDIKLNAGSGWPMLLDAIRNLRVSDRAANDVHYYALVSPATTFQTYCRNACIAGLSYLADAPSGRAQVGAGVGFTGTVAGETLAHELGHQHGRKHSPCGVENDATVGDYPYPDGASIGVWGFDFRKMELASPARYHDMMSYCEPWWMSDFTYSAIADRRQAIVRAPGARIVNIDNGSLVRDFRGYRSLLTNSDGAGGAVWGSALPADLVPDGAPELAKVLDDSGRVLAEVTVYRTAFGHAAGNVVSYDVPAPRAGWAAIQVANSPPLRFGAPISVPALVPVIRKNPL